MRPLSHPFRLGPDGRAVTITAGSDEHIAQQLALLQLTRPGEHPLAPEYGTADPTFDAVDPAETTVKARLFTPDADVSDVTVTQVDDVLARTVIEWR